MFYIERSNLSHHILFMAPGFCWIEFNLSYLQSNRDQDHGEDKGAHYSETGEDAQASDGRDAADDQRAKPDRCCERGKETWLPGSLIRFQKSLLFVRLQGKL